MKKILISLAIIGVVAGITLGITGAWWTDQGVSNNQSFVSGNLNLRLSNNGSSWGDNVSQTWSIDKMAPGGTPYESSLYMKNVGSVNTDYLKFTLKNTPDPAGMDRVMRITKLEYAGKNLLTGGAGANLGSYEPPVNCDINVHPGTYQKITEAISVASTGNTICVGPGNYSAIWESGVINVNKEVTIASTNGPEETTISAGIGIGASNVTIKGFKILPANPGAGGGIEGIYLPSAINVTIEYNEIDGTGFSGQVIGIETVSGANYADVKIENNVIHDLTTGIYTNLHTGIIDIQYNEIYNTVVGVGGVTGANVKYNVFHDNGEAIGADSSYTTDSVIKYNNFWGDMVKDYNSGKTIVAENNWWGDFDPSDQVSGNVDYTPYAGGPFIGFINGKDYNGNGFADLNDFYGVTHSSYDNNPIVVGNPDLLPNSGSYHTLKMGVQLDGPTTSNTFMGGKVGMEMTVTMGQGPAQ